MKDRYLLYVDILGFSDIARDTSARIDDLYEVIASLHVHRHHAFRTIVFSDTVIAYNVSEPVTAHDRRYLVMYLCEFAQDLQHRLIGREIFFRAVLVRGEFTHYELNSIPCFFGAALIDAHQSEKELKAIGLFMQRSIVPDSSIFTTVSFNNNFNFVFITQTLDMVEDQYGGLFPVERSLLEASDLIYNLVPEVLYLKRLSHLAQAHESANIRQKYSTTLALFRKRYPHTLEFLETNNFDFEQISPGAKWKEILSRYPESYSWAIKEKKNY
jgi:hypothetical protein